MCAGVALWENPKLHVEVCDVHKSNLNRPAPISLANGKHESLNATLLISRLRQTSIIHLFDFIKIINEQI